MSAEKSQAMKKRSRLYLFCEGTSIRGMAKVLRARTRFLKILWMTFVLVMTTILIIASTFLVLDYLQYKTAWKNSDMLDERTVFPSITLCSHNPFSVAANELWSTKKIYSPTEFRHNLFALAKGAYFKGTTEAGPYISLPLYDKVDIYYAQISAENASKLSHKDHMIRFCMNVYEGSSVISTNCSDDSFKLDRLSNAEYFNCWSIESKQGNIDTRSAQTHQIILSITPSSDIHEMKNSFLMDMLSRGEGIRMAVHEPGTFPDMDRNGINLQPGKMNEISFKTIRWHRRSTPKNPCKNSQPPIVDLGQSFSYTFSQCLNTELQRRSIKDCGCLSTRWPRPVAPSKTMPYCMKILGTSTKDLDDFMFRTSCADKITLQMKKLKADAEGTKCFKRCMFHTYELTTSVTKWSPSNRKLSKLKSIYNHFNKKISVQWLTDFEKLVFNDDNSTKTVSNNSNLDISFDDNSRFIYVSLTRKSFDIKQMTENLVLDINILISRIGGLCSLCIGLTCAFFMELIEFLYLYFCGENNNNYANNGQLDDAPNNSNHGSAEAPAWYNQPRQETSYQFPVDAPSHHVMLETDSSTNWNSPWHKMNSNHELSSRRMDPSISCV